MTEPVCPKTWMAESILVTVFCCLPFGIAGIVFASRVSSLYAADNYEAALQASKNAGKWTKIGFIVGLVAIVLYLLLYGVTFFSMVN